MITNEHKKHSDLSRPSYGNYCRNEWAIIGTGCSVIRSVADLVINALCPQYKFAYADAHHAPGDEVALLPGSLKSGAVAEYTNHLHYHQFSFTKRFSPFQYRQMFNDADG